MKGDDERIFDATVVGVRDRTVRYDGKTTTTKMDNDVGPPEAVGRGMVEKEQQSPHHKEGEHGVI